jgi:hypothetical protein
MNNQNTAAQNQNIKEENINVAIVTEVATLTAKQIETLNKSINALLDVYEAQGSYLIFAGNKAGSKIAAAKLAIKVPHANIGVGQEKGQPQFKYVVSAAGDSPCRKAISKAHMVIVLGGKQMGELSARTAKLANSQHKDCYGILADGNTVSQIYEGDEDVIVEPVFGKTTETKAEAPKAETKSDEDEGILVKKVTQENRGGEMFEEPVAEEPQMEVTAQYMADKLSMAGKKKAEKQPEAVVETKAEETLKSSLEYVKSQEVLDTSKMEKALNAKKAELAAARAVVEKLDKEVENMEKELEAAREAAAAVNRKNVLKEEILEKTLAMLREIDLGRVSSIEEAAEKLKTIGSRGDEVAKDIEKEGEKKEAAKKASVAEMVTESISEEEMALEEMVDTTGDIINFQGANYEVLVSDFDISLAEDPARELADATYDGRVRLDNFKTSSGRRYVVNGSFDYAAYLAATEEDKQRMMQAALDSGDISRVEKEVEAA